VAEEHGFRVLGSSTLCDAGFLSMSRLRVAGPDGDEFDRHVVRHPGAVVVVPVIATPDGRRDALLVRQWRVATGADLLEVPAGKRDVEGEAPETTANRELEEEIGYAAGRLDLLCEFYNSPGFCDEYTYLYLATELEARERAAVSAEEAAMTIERVALDQVDTLIATRELVDAKSIIGLLLARRFLDS
jgi:ADP-ribose diphosphatase